MWIDWLERNLCFGDDPECPLATNKKSNQIESGDTLYRFVPETHHFAVCHDHG